MRTAATARTVKIAAALAVVFGLVATAHAQTSTILNTKHNLSANSSTLAPGSTSANRFTPTTVADDEVCVFCHTPHAASTTAAAPLWNKNAPATIAYSLYSSTTMDAAQASDGPVAGKTAIGSISIACLSCHDGVNAMNTVINAPGSGFGTGSIPGTWTTGSGNMGTGITNLNDGTAGLSNDHPIGIAYCAWSAVTGTGAAAVLTCGDADFKAPSAGTAAGQTVFWLDTNATVGRQKNDIILYNRAFGTATGPSVECASCHDPHLEKYSDGTTARTFLRVANTGSKVCLSCHTK